MTRDTTPFRLHAKAIIDKGVQKDLIPHMSELTKLVVITSTAKLEELERLKNGSNGERVAYLNHEYEEAYEEALVNQAIAYILVGVAAYQTPYEEWRGSKRTRLMDIAQELHSTVMLDESDKKWLSAMIRKGTRMHNDLYVQDVEAKMKAERLPVPRVTDYAYSMRQHAFVREVSDSILLGYQYGSVLEEINSLNELFHSDAEKEDQ